MAAQQTSLPDGEKVVALTKYLVLTSGDGGRTWRLLGHQLAPSSEQALRRYFADPPIDQEGLFVAVSENAFRPRRVQATVRTSISEADLPGDDVEGGEEPAA